jgi:hypothetical protein
MAKGLGGRLARPAGCAAAHGDYCTPGRRSEVAEVTVTPDLATSSACHFTTSSSALHLDRTVICSGRKMHLL